MYWHIVTKLSMCLCHHALKLLKKFLITIHL